MKKSCMAPLCSAVVIPGLGQLINRNTKKGVALLSVVFVLFVTTLVIVYLKLTDVMPATGTSLSDVGTVLYRFKREDMTSLHWVAGIFLLVWAYSVVDAFITGRKRDRDEGSSP